MIRVGVSGILGRMGRVVAAAVAGEPDLELAAGVDRDGGSVEGVAVSGSLEAFRGCDVVVDFTDPTAVMDGLSAYAALEVAAVIGTSGFTPERVEEARARWKGSPAACLIVPNFSIGAVLMMRFAEEAAPYFTASEVIELHHDGKADAPSGTSVATAARLGAGRQDRAVDSTEIEAGARGARVGGVPVHSVRLPGLLAHQEVLLGNPGEVLTIRHDSTDRVSFVPGILRAIRGVGGLPAGVTVGLDAVL